MNQLRGGTRRKAASLLVGLLTVAVGLFASGCGSSSSSTASTASTAASTGSSSGVAEATAKLQAAQQGPTKWEGPTEPVKPPKSFNLALVTCDNASDGCIAPAKGAEEAAKLLGWKVTIYNGESNPVVQAKRVEQALADKATGIITESVDGRGIGTALADAKAAHVPVVSTSNAAAAGEQGYAVDVSPNFEQLGKDIGDWVISDSGGKGVLSTYVDKEYQSTITTTRGILEEMKTCSGCKALEPINFVAADLASKLAPQTVSELQSHPEVDYVHFAYDPAATFQVPAILQAGLGGKIKASSIIGDQQNLEFIKEGKVQAADAVWDNKYQGFASVDQLIRLADGKKPAVNSNVPERFKYNEALPSVLVTKANLPAAGKLYQAPFEYEAEYKKLWGLG